MVEAELIPEILALMENQALLTFLVLLVIAMNLELRYNLKKALSTLEMEYTEIVPIKWGMLLEKVKKNGGVKS